jgi:DivIVA domain-containing protein
MADDVSRSQSRARDFDVVRRGYDRAQVDSFLADLQAQMADLETSVDQAASSSLAVGIDEREALANELHTIGDEVAAVLEAARSAAEGLRKRAAKDAEQWRSEAEAETTEAVRSTREQTQALRASAWNEGSALLNSALAEAKAIRATAQEDALFMRAEAERDALRLTSDARRDKDEALRGARQEAEVILEEARVESEGMLAAAQKAAEAAQERARALEDRRSELLSELEATRASISHLEEEIDSRRQELETPEPEPELFDNRSQHDMDVGSVKIVAPSKAVVLRPVDPDELVADIEAIRASSARALEPKPAETVAVISPPPDLQVPSSEDQQRPSDGGSEQDPPDGVPPATEPAPVVAAESPPPSADPEVATEPEPATPVVADKGSDGQDASADEIGSLFAALKSMPEPAVQKQQVTTDEPTKAADKDTDDTAPLSSEPAAAELEPEPEPTTGGTSEVSVLGARNAALKNVKRSLVDLQNETLESLRTDPDWIPPDDYADRFEPDFSLLADVTGSAGAKNLSAAFASDLHDSVLSALEDARSAGKGDRAVAAAASKVFRTWRTDEAERRLQGL